MGARTFLVLAALSFSGIFCSTALALPDEVPTQEQPKVENSRFAFEALVNGSDVQVRSGPSENYYPTMKLEKGARIKVVGIKFDWLKILPPDGSFSVVAKKLVDRSGEAATGVINAENVNVRAGSSVNNVKITVQCKLNKGEIVEITGEDGDYYKIKPPTEAYVYVNQKFADPIKQLAGGSIAERTVKPFDNDLTGAGAATRPVKPKIDIVVERAESRQAKEAAEEVNVQVEFDRLEALAKTTWDKPLDDMPVAELLTGYESILKSDLLPSSQRAMSEVRVLALKAKSKAKQELSDSRKHQEEVEAKLAELQAQREAIEARLRSGQQVFTAVGKLQATAVKSGEMPVYRLTDPSTERTLCYVKSADTKYSDLIGKFIGVKGELTTDASLTLKTINPTEASEIDPAQVNKTISAQIVPPSLLGKGETASSTGAGEAH
jgi:uncharacterized protein YgiM (DUF1202 family)